MSRSAPRSWPSLSNRADPQNRQERPSNVRLSEREGQELREEVTYDNYHAVNALGWQEATERFRCWYTDQRDTEIVVRNPEGETAAFSTPNRFTPDYREMLYAKAQALERGLRERWGSLLHTSMITLTASSTDSTGRPRPPVDHLEDLLSSYEAVRRALSRVLEGREWEYLAVIEPHETGYAHVHIGVFVKGPVVAEQFKPVIDAHLRNCETAERDAHRLVDEEGHEDTVRVRQSSHPSRQGGVENLGAYLAAYFAGEYGKEATAMPEHVQRFYAVMWATGRQWFRPSNGAQELMQPEEESTGESLDWELVGIAPDGEPEEEVIEIDPEEIEGETFVSLRRHPNAPPPEPPPD